MTIGNLPSLTLYGIRTIAEQSVLAWFNANASLFPGVQLHAGQTPEVRSVPIIILHAESAQAHRDFGGTPLGNFEVTFKIYVYSSADDSTLEEHRQRVENVQAVMQDIPSLASAWTQGTLYAGWIVSDDEGVADRRYGNAISYTLVCVYPAA
jgi:hypothetical protein